MSKGFFSRINRSLGFTLVETLMGAGLLTMSALLSATIAQQYLAIKKAGEITRTASNLRDLLTENLNSLRGWNFTINNPANTSMACLANVALDCAPGGVPAGGPFAVYNGTGNIVFDPISSASNGLDRGGNRCSTFNGTAGAGDDACPFRFEVSWSAICTGNPCYNPQVSVRGDMKYNPAHQEAALNPAKYSFSFVKNLDPNAIISACVGLKGQFDPGTGRCTLPMVGNCPAGQIVVGLSASPGNLNQKLCRPMMQGSCPPGKLITSVNPDGTFVCTAMTCALPPPPAPAPYVPPPVAPGITFTPGIVTGLGGTPGLGGGGGDGGGDGGCGGGGGGCS